MTFLNPLILFGAAAAAIPVILHLLNLRKLRTIEFSTLTFLKELQQTKIRRLKVRQLLLLLLRTLVILCIVVAFARPALRGSFLGKLGGTAHSTVVFIFDDSFSMSASDQFGELLKQAKEKTERLIDLLNEGDEVYLIRLSDLPEATIDPATHDLNALRRFIRETNISMIRRPMADAVALAGKLLARSKNANKEVYIISDMQRTLFPAKLNGKDTTAIQPPDRKYFLVDIGVKSIDNVAVDSVEIVSKILEAGRPVEISARVRNYSGTPLTNYILSAFVENTRSAQSTLHIEPWGTATATLFVTPKHAGIIRGYVELENDAIEPDNRRYFTFTIPQHLNVAVVADNPGDAHYLLLALQASQADSVKSAMSIEQVATRKFPLVDLKTTDVLVLMNVQGISQSGIDNIRNFVRRGGGLLLTPAAAMQPSELNASLLPALDVPPVNGVMGSAASPASLSFQKVDLDHPIFSAIFDNSTPARQANEQGVESPRIGMALQQTPGRTGHEIISMTGGYPFLTEYLLGEGKILFFSVSPVMSWSDFPLKGIFVPLIHRSVVYLAAQERSAPGAITGQDALIVVPPTEGGTAVRYTLASPDGTLEFLLPVNAMEQQNKDTTRAENPAADVPPGMLGFLKSRVPLPGYYDLKNGPSVLAVLSANVDGSESDTRKMGGAELKEAWRRWGIAPEVIAPAEQAAQLQSTVMQSRFGVELWKYFLAAALMFALAEMFIARDARRNAESS